MGDDFRKTETDIEPKMNTNDQVISGIGTDAKTGAILQYF